MSLVRLAELEIDPVQLDRYKALLAAQISAAIEREAGVLMLYAVSVRERPQQVRVVEVYADQAAYEAHIEAPHFLAYKAATAAMVRSLKLIETDPIALCGKATSGAG